MNRPVELDIEGPNTDPDIFDDLDSVRLGARAVLVHPFIKGAPSRRTPEAALEELVSLGSAIDLQVVETQLCPLNTIRPATYLGQGRLDGLTRLVERNHVEVVVVNAPLSPVPGAVATS